MMTKCNKVQGCDKPTTTITTTTEEPLLIAYTDDWLESPWVGGFKVWQVIFMAIAAILTVIICLCCCIRFRIPRTKQEIEADYVRKKITRKFQKQLKMIQNSEMDEMDLKRALDRIRAEFKSDTESLAQSEGFSISSSAVSEDRRKSSVSVIGVSIEELIERRNSGFAARFASFVSILRPRKNTSVQQKKPKLKLET